MLGKKVVKLLQPGLQMALNNLLLTLRLIWMFSGLVIKMTKLREASHVYPSEEKIEEPVKLSF